MAFVFMLALAWLAWSYVDYVCPLATRLVRGLWQWAVRLLWTKPVRRYGLTMTVAIWLLAVAVLMTFFGFAALASGSMGPLLMAVFMWVFVFGWWQVMRWLAHRRFDPRRLPTRHDDRRDVP